MMTDRTWEASVGAFDEPLNWSPPGIPQAGDMLDINSGVVDASSDTLSGYTIDLGGPSAGPGPGYYAQGNEPIESAPNPTLILSGSTLAQDTSVLVPAGFFNLVSADSATILVDGTSSNDGNIEAGGGLLNTGSNLYFSIYANKPNQPDEGSAVTYINNGTITADANSTITFFGFYYLGGPDWMVPGDFSNNGEINVYGTVYDTQLQWYGSGIINLDATPSFLGLAATPGQFIYDRFNANQDILGGQTIAFHGGQLTIDGSGFPGSPPPDTQADFRALLTNFGMDPTDLITLQDFSVGSTTFTNGVLDLHSATDNSYTSLHFGALPSFGHLAITQSGANTDITWAYLTLKG
jgi:hypothetical protein